MLFNLRQHRVTAQKVRATCQIQQAARITSDVALGGNLNHTARQGLSARIRFASANRIFSLAVCFLKPRYRVFRYRNSPLTTPNTCSTLARTDDFSCSLRFSCAWDLIELSRIYEEGESVALRVQSAQMHIDGNVYFYRIGTLPRNIQWREWRGLNPRASDLNSCGAYQHRRSSEHSRSGIVPQKGREKKRKLVKGRLQFGFVSHRPGCSASDPLRRREYVRYIHIGSRACHGPFSQFSASCIEWDYTFL